MTYVFHVPPDFDGRQYNLKIDVDGDDKEYNDDEESFPPPIPDRWKEMTAERFYRPTNRWDTSPSEWDLFLMEKEWYE